MVIGGWFGPLDLSRYADILYPLAPIHAKSSSYYGNACYAGETHQYTNFGVKSPTMTAGIFDLFRDMLGI